MFMFVVLDRFENFHTPSAEVFFISREMAEKCITCGQAALWEF